jgi:F0F1-type ATP synthase delta subunit
MTLSRTIATTLVEKNISVDVLVEVLRKYNLLQLLPNIKKELLHLERYTKMNESLIIESPFPLSSHAIEHIRSITKSGDSPHEIRIVEDLLAGFKARHKGILYDASAKKIIKHLTN